MCSLWIRNGSSRNAALLLRYRSLNAWSWRNLLPSSDSKNDSVKEVTVEKSPQSREEILHNLACSYLGEGVGDTWRTASLGDANKKGKILCKYESAFSMSIPNQDLGAITTFGDLLEILENYQPPEEARNVYPLFQDTDLPPNLNVQFINTAPIPRKTRKPFDNLGMVRERERGKKKRGFIRKPRELGRGKTREKEDYKSGW